RTVRLVRRQVPSPPPPPPSPGGEKDNFPPTSGPEDPGRRGNAPPRGLDALPAAPAGAGGGDPGGGGVVPPGGPPPPRHARAGAEAGVDELGRQLEAVGQRRLRVGRLGLVVLADLLEPPAAGVSVRRGPLHEVEQGRPLTPAPLPRGERGSTGLDRPLDDLAL